MKARSPAAVQKNRKLRSGRLVRDYDFSHQLTISTQCPSKWLFVDLEDANIWVSDHEKDPWRAATREELREAILLMRKVRAELADG